MSTPKIEFNRGKGGLGRPLSSSDHVSGLVFYNSNLPAGFSANDRTKLVYSVEQAVDLGIAKGSANHSLEYYQIETYFKNQPKGKLFVSIQDVPGTPASHAFGEIGEIQAFANGEIRQLGLVFTIIGVVAMDSGGIAAIQTAVDALKAIDQPLNVLIGFDDSALASPSDYATLATQDAENVSVVISQDGDNEGKALATSLGTSNPAVGAFLGMVSFANVHENIGWVAKFNFKKDAEFSTPQFTSGDDFKTISAALEDTLNDYGFLFLKNHVGNSGTFANYSWTSTAQTGDFSTIENNRTLDKAIRLIKTLTLPTLNSPIDLNSDGTMTDNQVAIFESIAGRAIDQMERDGEISSGAATVDPAQNVVSTSKVTLAVAIVPKGVARELVYNIGFATSLTD